MARGVGRPKKTDAGGAPVRKQRRKKDKNAPKRALSAFMFFSNDIRETVKREMPELEFLQISMEIGRRWKEITSEDRKVCWRLWCCYIDGGVIMLTLLCCFSRTRSWPPQTSAVTRRRRRTTFRTRRLRCVVDCAC